MKYNKMKKKSPEFIKQKGFTESKYEIKQNPNGKLFSKTSQLLSYDWIKYQPISFMQINILNGGNNSSHPLHLILSLSRDKMTFFGTLSCRSLV